MSKSAVLALVLSALATGGASAQCAANFTQEGVPLVTGISYRTWTVIPGTRPDALVKELARAVSAEGFDDIEVNAALGSISALQETTGSGRPQTLRVTARKAGKGARVDATFFIPPGQVASGDVVKTYLCRIIESVR